MYHINEEPLEIIPTVQLNLHDIFGLYAQIEQLECFIHSWFNSCSP